MICLPVRRAVFHSAGACQRGGWSPQQESVVQVATTDVAHNDSAQSASWTHWLRGSLCPAVPQYGHPHQTPHWSGRANTACGTICI